MNQILINENKNKQKKVNNSNLLDMRKVILIFSVLIIIFALIIVGAKVYGIVKENNKQKNVALNKPTIEITEVEQRCRILVEYKDVGLDKVIYSWNDGDDIVRNLNDSDNYDNLINIPEGIQNTLYVKAIGSDGSESELTKTFTRSGEVVNPEGPSITLEQIAGTNTMKVIVFSEKGIDNFTYQWNGDEIVTTEGAGEENVEIIIDIKRGVNEITINATDVEGNEQIKQELINGIKLPEIFVEIKEGNLLYMTVTHDLGIEKIIYKVGNQELIYDENFPAYEPEKKEFTIFIPLEPGETLIEITAYSIEGENSVTTIKRKADI